MPSTLPAVAVSDATFELWQRLAEFPASQTDVALKYLQAWIAEKVGADNVVWIGAVRVLYGPTAQKDAFLGWRLRERIALRPDPEPYRKQLAQYFDSEHYGKLTPTFYNRSHEAQKEDHVGMDSRATMAGCGRFRTIRIRDKNFLDFSVFKKTSHYKRYYLDAGIEDRMSVAFPITAHHESFFMLDRFQATKPRRHFTAREAIFVGNVLRGVPQLHRRLFLNNGLFAGDKLLSPLQREILQGLLTGQTENEMAVTLRRNPGTLHKYVRGLYTLFGVKSRQAFMALWLEGNQSVATAARHSR